METVVLIIIWIIAAISVRYILSVYNGIVTLDKKIDKTMANIDLLIKQRDDEIIKLIERVNDKIGDEKITARVEQKKNACLKADSIPEIDIANSRLDEALNKLFETAEDHPQIEEDREYVQLKSRIEDINNMIADRKDSYNNYVNNFNKMIKQNPHSYIARILQYNQREDFGPEDNEKNNSGNKL